MFSATVCGSMKTFRSGAALTCHWALQTRRERGCSCLLKLNLEASTSMTNLKVNFLGMRYTGGINWEAEAGELQVQS